MDSDSLSTLLDALHLTITGNIPQSVLQKADKRMKRYKEQMNPLAYTSDCSSDTSLEEHSTAKKQKYDLILGITQPEAESDIIDSLPSDPEYWSLDACDLDPFFRSLSESLNVPCGICNKKGHYYFECSRVSKVISKFLCHSLSHLIVFFVKS